MHNIITEKVPNGKLVRIKIDYNDVIENIQITGDFFLHPEGTLEEIEKVLIGITTQQDPDIIKDVIQSVLSKHNAQFIGATVDDVVRMIKQAVKQ